jgi:two-component system cell cycle response regulator
MVQRPALKLLLVDDCVAERDLYQMVLEPEFTILTASRGDEGVAVATRAHPDVIILDVTMPGLTGWEACTRIKSDPGTEHIPVILLTGADDHDLSQHARAVGASALLRKPCPADQLRGAIRAATDMNAFPARQY